MFDNSQAGVWVTDLYNSSTSCYISIAMSVVYSLVFIYLMSAFAEPIAWFCVVLLQLSLAGATAALWFSREKKIQAHQDMLLNKVFLPDSEQDKEATDRELYMLIAVIIAGVLTLGFFCCVCCGMKSLKLAIDVIDASADFLAGTKRILLVPGVFFIFQIITVLIWVAAMMCVVSMNEITVDETIPQGKNLVWEKKT